MYTAYWIAFGPHGPRAETPPGENTKVAIYTAIGVGVALGIFLLTHHFAGPKPHTLSKEWEEATNEYFKVRRTACPRLRDKFLYFNSVLTCPFLRKTESSQSPVCQAKATRAKARCKARRKERTRWYSSLHAVYTHSKYIDTCAHPVCRISLFLAFEVDMAGAKMGEEARDLFLYLTATVQIPMARLKNLAKAK